MAAPDFLIIFYYFLIRFLKKSPAGGTLIVKRRIILLRLLSRSYGLAITSVWPCIKKDDDNPAFNLPRCHYAINALPHYIRSYYH